MGGLNKSGFDPKDIEAEIGRGFRQLRALSKDVQTKDVKRLQRISAKIATEQMRAEVTDLKSGTFQVFRNGEVYADIKPGQLRESIGEIKTTVREKKLFSAVAIGPRTKGEFANQNKGGWFAHFVEYGYLNNGKYRGENFGFASRANQKAMPKVRRDFYNRMLQFMAKRIKKATAI